MKTYLVTLAIAMLLNGCAMPTKEQWREAMAVVGDHAAEQSEIAASQCPYNKCYDH